MSMFENNGYRWRETYFVQFDSVKRPSLKKIQKAISALSDRFTLTNLAADEQGLAESLTPLSPDDFSALDICYLSGEEVLEQGAECADDMDLVGCSAEEKSKLEKLRHLDGRFDVLHFEQVLEDADDELDESLDPSALILVLEALAQLTDGIAVDPQTGTLQ